MSQALTTLFVEAGHEVRLTNSRGPESLQELVSTYGSHVMASTVAEAVPWADAVFLATPWGKTAEAVSVVDDWSGVVVVDTTNNRTKPGPDGLIDIGDSVSSVIVAGYVPGAQVVKALNVTPIPWMSAALGADSSDTNAVYVAGDDAGPVVDDGDRLGRPAPRRCEEHGVGPRDGLGDGARLDERTKRRDQLLQGLGSARVRDSDLVPRLDEQRREGLGHATGSNNGDLHSCSSSPKKGSSGSPSNSSAHSGPPR